MNKSCDLTWHGCCNDYKVIREETCDCGNVQGGMMDQAGTDGASNSALVTQLQSEIQVRSMIVVCLFSNLLISK